METGSDTTVYKDNARSDRMAWRKQRPSLVTFLERDQFFPASRPFMPEKVMTLIVLDISSIDCVLSELNQLW